MELTKGDLVRYSHDPHRLAIVTMTHITGTGAHVCEVIIVSDPDRPECVGQKRYANQDYWKKISPPKPSLDASIAECREEYEEVIELHKTYGES